jgi:hypothetical protein
VRCLQGGTPDAGHFGLVVLRCGSPARRALKRMWRRRETQADPCVLRSIQTVGLLPIALPSAPPRHTDQQPHRPRKQKSGKPRASNKAMPHKHQLSAHLRSSAQARCTTYPLVFRCVSSWWCRVGLCCARAASCSRRFPPLLPAWPAPLHPATPAANAHSTHARRREELWQGRCHRRKGGGGAAV